MSKKYKIEHKFGRMISYLSSLTYNIGLYLSSDIESLVEDYDMQEYILGEWKNDILAEKTQKKLRLAALDFYCMYNTIPRPNFEPDIYDNVKLHPLLPGIQNNLIQIIEEIEKELNEKGYSLEFR